MQITSKVLGLCMSPDCALDAPVMDIVSIKRARALSLSLSVCICGTSAKFEKAPLFSRALGRQRASDFE